MDAIGIALEGAQLAKDVRAAFDRIRRMNGWSTTDASLWIGPELHRLDDAAARMLARLEPKDK